MLDSRNVPTACICMQQVRTGESLSPDSYRSWTQNKQLDITDTCSFESSSKHHQVQEEIQEHDMGMWQAGALTAFNNFRNPAG